MNKTIVEVSVSCNLQCKVQPQDTNFYGQFPLEDFIHDLYNNCHFLDLLLENETINTNQYELTPQDNNLVQVRSVEASDAPFVWLSLEDLTSIHDVLSSYRKLLTVQSLEIGLMLSEPQCEVNRVVSSEFDGHAYQNIENLDIEITEQNKNIDGIIFSLDQFNRLSNRSNCFEEVSDVACLRSVQQGNPISDDGFIKPTVNCVVNKEEDDQLFKNKIADFDKKLTSYTNNLEENYNGFIKPVEFSEFGSDTEKSDLEKETPGLQNQVINSFSGILPSISSHVPKQTIETPALPTTTVSSLCTSSNSTPNFRELPNESLPPDGFNAIGTLAEYLVQEGARETLQYMPEEHRTTTHSAFSNSVVFTLSMVQYRYASDTYWKRKTEAKNNVAYKACLAHGLPRGKNDIVTVKDNQTYILPLGIFPPLYGSRSSTPNVESLPPDGFNAIGTLAEYLVQEGARETLQYMPEEHRTTTHSAFSNSVVFTLSMVQYRYASGSHWRRKTDAKHNVAYQACLAHGLPKP